MIRRGLQHGFGALLLACLVSHSFGAEPADPLLEELIERGVRLPSGQVVRLPRPTMPDGLDAARQTELVKTIAGKHPLDRFVRDSVVAPFVLDIASVEDDRKTDTARAARVAQRLDFYFVAHGSIETLLKDGLFGELVGAAERESSSDVTLRTLSAEELQTRGVEPRKFGEATETFVAIDVPVLERVKLAGVGVGVKQKSPDSILGVWKLDDRFANDAKLPNRWRPIVRDAAGRTSLGDPRPYAGLAGYIKITRLEEPAGALLVECHAVFDEPRDWFDGRNLLRSKLPLVVQDNVRTFRRKLAAAEKGS